MTAWELFLNDLSGDKLHHAYLFHGGDAAANAGLLRRAAAAAVCTGGADSFLSDAGANTIRPCGKCLDCQKAANNTHPDIYSIPAEGKKILVDDVNALIEDSYVRPLESERKVYCLFNFDEANEKAQNKLLKTLEEPVKNTLFLLSAASLEPVLPTVKSRVKKLALETDLASFLSRAATPESAVITDTIADMYRNMRASADILDYVNRFARFRDLSKSFLNLLELYTRDIILYKTDNAELLLYNGKKNDIMFAAEDFSLPALAGILNNIAAARRNLNFNVNAAPVLDALLYGILEEKHKCPT